MKSSPPFPFPTGLLECLTAEGLEALAGKKIEYGNRMDDHAADLEAVIPRQLLDVKLAEERRVKWFQGALERMDPVEDLRTKPRAERERPFYSNLQRRTTARAAAFDAECFREIARIRGK